MSPPLPDESPGLDLSVLVPVYNEVDNVVPLHAELDAVLRPSGLSYELIFVDDGSTDGTAAPTDARSTTATRRTSASPPSAATAARPPPSPPPSTWPAAASSSPSTATAKTTRPISPGSSTGSIRASTSSPAGAKHATTPG